jgi:NhaA family Na+:H+ antiporter
MRSAARLRAFLARESAGGMFMILCALAAMAAANSVMAPAYEAFRHARLLGASMHAIVNDGLMAVFFLLVGMELKREMLEGVLAQRSQKVLPLLAAMGGIAAPALIYLAFNHAIPAHHSGWAIPTATDIAFASCVLGLCGARVPASAKIFLLALAIYDDLAAIAIIALFYSSGLQWLPLLAAAGVTLGMGLLSYRGHRFIASYLLLGAALWQLVHMAGIHTTVAGMVTGLCIPMRVHGKTSASPLNNFLHILHPYVAFGILPLFAFTNAGVHLAQVSLHTLREALPLGIALGLFLGKPLGILSATWLSVKLGLADRPAGTSWRVLLAVGVIAGIGFTMSLFINLLAFDTTALREAATLGIFVGSVMASLCGIGLMRWATK